MHRHPRKPISPYSQKHCQQVKGSDSPPLVCFCETALGVLCPALGPLAQERQGTFGVSPEKGHKNNQRAGVPLHVRKDRDSYICSAQREGGVRSTLLWSEPYFDSKKSNIFNCLV